MLTPDAGFLDRRIAQEAVTFAKRGAVVDIFPVLGPLPDPVPTAPGVRMLEPIASAARRGRFERRARDFKALLKKHARPLHRLADAAQYSVMDRAGEIASAHLPQLLAMPRYDLVFAHDIPVLPLGAMLKRAWGCPLICDLHEIFPETEEVLGSVRASQYWRGIETRFLPLADGVMGVNEAVTDYARKTCCPDANLAVVHNSVPYEALIPRRPGALHQIYGIPTTRKVMVFGGSYRPDNNLETMVDGFGRARLDGWVLALIGSGAIQDRLTVQIREQGLADRVFIGHRAPQADLIETLASADAGLIPYLPVSKNLLICTPNKLYEYIQARLPIASAKLPLIAPVLSRYRNGAVLDYTSPDALAAALRTFVEVDLPGITSAALEDAAREVNWEADETELLSLVSRAAGDAATATQQLTA